MGAWDGRIYKLSKYFFGGSNVFLGGGSSSNNNNSRMKSIVRLYLKERCILTIVTFPPPPRPRKVIYLIVSYISDPCGTSV